MNEGAAKSEFWESVFAEKKDIWGFEPTASTLLARDFFLENAVKNVLIPGFGYGRNAQVFRSNGMAVTGIEISGSAIKIARKHYGNTMTIYHGSVTDMPFDVQKYDGIFCYALIHLLDSDERAKLISDCYNQLTETGYMIFTVITKQASTYRQGKEIDKDRFEQFGGVNMFFYDEESVRAEFGNFGLVEITEVMETYPFFLIKCKKEKSGDEV